MGFWSARGKYRLQLRSGHLTLIVLESQDEFLRLAKGKPDYIQYSTSMLHGLQEAVADFATRTPHLSDFQSLSFCEERKGDNLLYYRANS